MKTLLAVPALLLALTACGDEGGSTATDLGSGWPTEIPAAPGLVRTANLVTVMDTGAPELCLGPIAESWPPQCGGPPIDGWSWADHDGWFERQQDIRWGQFVVTGTWDGMTFTATGGAPAALYDPPVDGAAPVLPQPSVEHSPEELEAIAEEVGSGLPGAQGAYAEGGNVLVDVTYDDGSLQAWVDEEYGEAVVVVSSMLVDVPVKGSSAGR